MEILNSYVGLFALLSFIGVAASAIGLYVKQSNAEKESALKMSDLSAQIEEYQDQTSQRLSEQSKLIQGVNESQIADAQELSKALIANKEALTQEVNDVGGILSSTINKKIQSILDALSVNSEGYKDSLAGVAERFTFQQNKLFDYVSGLQEQSAKQQVESVEALSLLQRKIDDVDRALGSAQQVLSSKVESSQDEIVSSLSSTQERMVHLGKTVTQTQNAVEDSLREAISDHRRVTEDSVKSVVREVKEAGNEVGSLFSSTINQQISVVLDALSASSESYKDSLADVAEAIAVQHNKLMDSVSGLREQSAQQQGESLEALSSLQSEVASVDNVLGTVQQVLSSKVESSHDEILSSITSTQERLVSLGDTVTKSQNAVGDSVREAISDHRRVTEDLLQGVIRKVDETSEDLVNHTNSSLYNFARKSFEHAVLVAQSVRVDLIERSVEGEEIKIETPEAVTILSGAKVTKVTDKNSGTETYFEYENGVKKVARSYLDDFLKYQVDFDSLGNLYASTEYDENGHACARYIYDSTGEVEKFEEFC